MKNKKITKSEFIRRFNEINDEYKSIVKDIKKIVKKTDKLLGEGESLYIESKKDVFSKPSFKSLPKMMNRLDEIDNLLWYV